MRARAILLGALAAAFACPLSAGADDSAVAGFTPAQADQGARLYGDNCAACHGPNVNDGEFGPSLNGARFKRQWGGASAAGLFAYMTSSMPPSRTGILQPEEYAALMAFLLRANGAAPGDKPLPSSLDALSPLTIPK